MLTGWAIKFLNYKSNAYYVTEHSLQRFGRRINARIYDSAISAYDGSLVWSAALQATVFAMEKTFGGWAPTP